MTYNEYKDYLIFKLGKLGANLLRDDQDIDFGLIEKEKKEDICQFLYEEEFVNFKNSITKMNFKKFYKGQLIDIDIDIDINNEFTQRFFYDIRIKEEFVKKYFSYPEKNDIAMNTLRYFLLLRGSENEKYRNFFLDNRDEIVLNGFYFRYINEVPLRKKINFEEFYALVNRSKSTLFKYIKYKYILYMLIFKIKNILPLRGKRGRIIAILGIDGVGKSTIVDILSKSLSCKKVYLGDKSIKYRKIYKLKSIKIISIFVQYFEKLFRIVHLKLLTLRGVTVITDRYYFETENNSLKSKVKSLMYNKLFIKPDVVVVLYAEPKTILKRKNEVTAKEIYEFNKNISTLPFKNILKIKNDNLDDTLNKLLLLFKK